MADIVYTYRGKVYLNITNRCPCRCTFCIRSNGDGLGSAHTLWHKSDPTAEEIAKAIEEFDFSDFPEVTFCGYGEPLCAFDNLVIAGRLLKSKYPDIKIRINTNGLGNLINKKRHRPRNRRIHRHCLNKPQRPERRALQRDIETEIRHRLF